MDDHGHKSRVGVSPEREPFIQPGGRIKVRIEQRILGNFVVLGSHTCTCFFCAPCAFEHILHFWGVTNQGLVVLFMAKWGVLVDG